RNVIISNCHLYHNRGAGLFLDDCNLHQINVVGSHISYNAAGGIVVRGGAVRNLHVGTCDIEANTVNVLIEGGPTSPGATAEVAIVGCTLQHSGGPNSANIRFIGADEKGQRAWGHLTIANNVMSDVLVNIDIQKAREVAIVGNTAWTGYEYNLRVRDSSNVVIGPNVFGRNPKYASTERDDSAIRLEDCEDVTISGLHVHGVRNAPAGLVLANCRRMNVTGCSILDCDNAGVLLDKVAHSRVSDCLIRNDLADAKTWTPLRVVGGRGIMITGNQTSRPIEGDPNAAQASGNMVAP
ncbi:MAG: right-handed parallel beta-helix repeat-containing protein, partial [Planctomycetia bacterium]|nr:right-handed parallel beta-helix repeat-containing protein [Planctomycetia bacterium]